MTQIDGINFTQLTNLNLTDNLYLNGGELPDEATAPLILNSSFDSEVSPLELMSGADNNDYTKENSSLIMLDAAGDEIWRIWSMDPNDGAESNDNLFIGVGAGDNIDPVGFQGTWNTSCGGETLVNLDVGFRNSAFGSRSMQDATDASECASMGVGAMQNVTQTADTSAFGTIACLALTTGADNCGLGYGTLTVITNDIDNTAIGFGALANTSADANTCIGYTAGNQLTSAEDCIVIGAGIQPASVSLAHQINIGDVITGSINPASPAIIIAMQTVDPLVLGALWNNNDTLSVSAGPP